MNRDLIIFMGPPGAGKGSISQLCVAKLGWTQLSTGALCRKHITENTAIGQQIDFLLKSGNLVSDQLMTTMVIEWLTAEYINKDEPIIFDGFPRTLMQARSFIELILQKYETIKVKIIRFVISEEKIVHRLSARYICNGSDCQRVYSSIIESGLRPQQLQSCDRCGNLLIIRADDKNVQTIKHRFTIYKNTEEDIINFYKQHGISVTDIDVDRGIDLIFEEIKKAVVCR